MSIKSDLTIRFWNDLKRLPTRFNEVSIHLRKISSVFEDEMTNGNQYCDFHIFTLFLDLIESIDEYHDSRKGNDGTWGESSNPERDEKLMEKWEKIKSIRTFPKGVSTYPNGKERTSIDYDGFKSQESSRISKICCLFHDEWWDDERINPTEEYIEEYMNPKVEKGSSNQVEGVMV